MSEAADEHAPPESGRRLAVLFLWLGVAICALVAAVAGYLSYHAQYAFEYAHDGGNRLAASMFAALADSVIAATSLIALYRAVSGRVPGKISVLNLAFIGLSTMLNAFAAQNGGKAMAAAIVPPVAFAITYHLVLDQVRDHILTQRGTRLDGRGAAEISLGLLLWLARLLLSPRTTLVVLRRHIIDTAPEVPFGRRPEPPRPPRERPAVPASADAAKATTPPARTGTAPPALAPADTDTLTDQQKALRARETYLAYQREGRALSAGRLAQLSGYSTRNARRKLQDLAAAHGLFHASKNGDDAAFATAVLERLSALPDPVAAASRRPPPNTATGG